MRIILVAVVFFLIGYAVRPIISFRSFLTIPGSTSLIPGNTDSGSPNSKDVTISYDGKRFIPDRTTIEAGRYLTIINSSQSLMWLVSSDARFSTPRGYGYKEQVRERVNSPGVFEVGNKLNPGATASIEVKK